MGKQEAESPISGRGWGLEGFVFGFFYALKSASSLFPTLFPLTFTIEADINV